MKQSFITYLSGRLWIDKWEFISVKDLRREGFIF